MRGCIMRGYFGTSFGVQPGHKDGHIALSVFSNRQPEKNCSSSSFGRQRLTISMFSRLNLLMKSVVTHGTKARILPMTLRSSRSGILSSTIFSFRLSCRPSVGMLLWILKYFSTGMLLKICSMLGSVAEIVSLSMLGDCFARNFIKFTLKIL